MLILILPSLYPVLNRQARKQYAEVCRCQPRASQGWLEWSKMEEENGKLRKALDILKLGLKVCASNEALLAKVIKLQERLHSYEEVRGMLSRLRHESIDKIWKSVLEGSLFEARMGNIPVSRKLFKYLIAHVPWYGPIYHEAFQLEEKEGNDPGALAIIKKGLNELPRYGPLWFGLFRVLERQDVAAEYAHWQRGGRPLLANLVQESAEAVRVISRELVWKVHFELSQSQERAAEVAAVGLHLRTGCDLAACRDRMLEDARQSLVRSLLSCPTNLRWRVLLAGARMELGVGAVDKARQLLRQALTEVPIKSKSSVYLECSRVEEYLENADTSRLLLQRARQEMHREWKVALEMVMIEARAGEIEGATRLAKEAVRQHNGSGRLWSTYIQLCHRLEMRYFHETEVSMIESRLGISSPSGERPQKQGSGSVSDVAAARSASLHWLSKARVLRRAVAEVPKSGEVWCERGRCHLNPMSVHCFDPSLAQQSLCFATQFTPQYGDTFVEYVRLEMVTQVFLPKVLKLLHVPVAPFVQRFLAEDPEADLLEVADRLVGASLEVDSSASLGSIDRETIRQHIYEVEKMKYEAGHLVAELSAVVIKRINRRYVFSMTSPLMCEFTLYSFRHCIWQYRCRCVNADPNYGSVWFHCRDQPYDVPSAVLRSAVHQLVHELTSAQKIYVRALFHFVRRCLSQCNKPRSSPPATAEGNVNPSRSYSSLTLHRKVSAAEAGATQSSANQSANVGVSRSLNGLPKPSQPSEKATSASDTSNLGRTELGGGAQLRRSQEELLATRAEEALEDCAAVERLLTAEGWPGFSEVHLLPVVEVDGGSLFTSPDFVTGMIAMNRDMCNPALSAEAKRKHLFGSDQIVS